MLKDYRKCFQTRSLIIIIIIKHIPFAEMTLPVPLLEPLLRSIPRDEEVISHAIAEPSSTTEGPASL